MSAPEGTAGAFVLTAGGGRAPWPLRHPARLSALLLLGLGATLLSAQALQDRMPFGAGGTWPDFRSILSHVFLVSYLPGACIAVTAGARRRLQALGALSLAGEAGSRLAIPPFGRPTEGWVAAGIAGLLAGVLGPSLSQPSLRNDFWEPATWSPEVWWHRILGLAAGMLLGWFFFAALRTSWAFSRAARELPPVDPLDTAGLAPFAQQGLTNGLLAAGMVSLGGFFVLDQGITPMMVVLEGSSMVLVALALALPVLGVRRRVREAKLRELARCDAAIREGSRAFRAAGLGAARPAPPPGASDPSLAELLAYRSVLEQVREWPADAPLLRRMLLYLLIPLGSWVASAFVQHIVESAVLKP